MHRACDPMRAKLVHLFFGALFGLCGLAGGSAQQALPEATAGGGAQDGAASDPTAPDRFLPGFDGRVDPRPTPRRGGSVVVHADSMPRHLNYFLENSGTARRVQLEVHETLLARDEWTTEPRLVLASALEIDDTLVLRDGRRLLGKARELEEDWELVPCASPGSPPGAPLRLPKRDVERVERETVFTFTLRDGVRWHDGRPLRVEDFLLTWRLSKNPRVECDEKRFEYDHVVGAEKLDERTLRYTYDRQFFGARYVFETLIPLPAHRYDLLDPLNPDFDPTADEARQAEYVNRHPCNVMWIGLGPYRVTEVTKEYIQAERFEGYFDAQHAGWLDRIRWRYFAGDAAYRALLDGELDFSQRLSADDYFSAQNEPRFTERFYRGYYYTPQMTFVAWNTLRPQFSDARVRTALALAFDWDEFVRTYYRGLAARVTAEWYDGGPDYDRTLAALPFDLERAARLLSEAGWYDRDGDGWVDRDGRALSFRLMVQAGNPTGAAFGQRFQESLRRVGVKLELEALDWGTLVARVREREFEAALKAWVMPVESTPEQRWHSRSVGPGTANDTSYSSAELDPLIERFNAELDPQRRGAIGREIQRRLYAVQAFMYGVKVPHKFAIDKRLRNVRFGPIDPGYRIRDWFFADERAAR
ncbi:MAG: hypothetical protein IT454_10785 [Planctomycetes bacterium]|nr:hypothetical protein [Planctomycetota bacterium]